VRSGLLYAAIRYWSTRKTGQDEAQLRTSGGALQPVMSVQLREVTVLVRGQKGASRFDVLQADDNMPDLLRSMQYSNIKEVRCALTFLAG
jgi:hypothetical protein